MRIVLDTSVVVAAFRSPKGASAQLLGAGVEGRIILLASSSLFFEYEAVLKRSDHLLAAGATTSDVDKLLDALLEAAERVRIDYIWRPQLADPDDEHVLAAAVAGRADVLATFERGAFDVACSRFGLQALSPRDALARMKRWT